MIAMHEKIRLAIAGRMCYYDDERDTDERLSPLAYQKLLRHTLERGTG